LVDVRALDGVGVSVPKIVEVVVDLRAAIMLVVNEIVVAVAHVLPEIREREREGERAR